MHYASRKIQNQLKGRHRLCTVAGTNLPSLYHSARGWRRVNSGVTRRPHRRVSVSPSTPNVTPNLSRNWTSKWVKHMSNGRGTDCKGRIRQLRRIVVKIQMRCVSGMLYYKTIEGQTQNLKTNSFLRVGDVIADGAYITLLISLASGVPMVVGAKR